MNLLKKLKTRRIAGSIIKHVEILGEEFIFTRQDPNSNYISKPDITGREVKDETLLKKLYLFMDYL